MNTKLKFLLSLLFLTATVLPVFATFPGNCLIFENNKYVVCTGVPSYGAITIEGWVNHSSLATYTQRYFTMMDETAVIRKNGGNIDFYFKSSSGSITHVSYAYPLSVGEWIHVAGTYDGTAGKLYVNGNLVNSVTTSGGIYTNTGELRIGNDGESMVGKIDEVRLWNIARTQEQIANNCNRELSVPQTGLQSYWKFDESSGTTAIDACGHTNGTLVNMTDANWVASTVPASPPAMGEMLTPLCTMDTTNPLVTVLTPNGGEVLYSYQFQNIMWAAGDTNFSANSILIEFSADDGSSYTSLAANNSNSGSYGWTVPTTATDQARIRISASDSFGNIGSDESNAAFTLEGTSVMITPLITVDCVDPIADLLSPNGGESMYIGQTQDILWTASDSRLALLPIKLEYKKVSTGLWVTIQPELNNTGAYSWQLPSITSAETLVRLTVRDEYGNVGTDVSLNPFSICYAQPGTPLNVNVQIVNNRDAVITWSPVILDILGSPIEPSAYLIIYNQTTDPENDAAYYYLGENHAATGYTHLNVARRAPRMWYRVVAVMDSEERLSGVLASLKSDNAKDAPISWMELKARLNDLQ